MIGISLAISRLVSRSVMETTSSAAFAALKASANEGEVLFSGPTANSVTPASSFETKSGLKKDTGGTGPASAEPRPASGCTPTAMNDNKTASNAKTSRSILPCGNKSYNNTRNDLASYGGPPPPRSPMAIISGTSPTSMVPRVLSPYPPYLHATPRKASRGSSCSSYQGSMSEMSEVNRSASSGRRGCSESHARGGALWEVLAIGNSCHYDQGQRGAAKRPSHPSGDPSMDDEHQWRARLRGVGPLPWGPRPVASNQAADSCDGRGAHKLSCRAPFRRKKQKRLTTLNQNDAVNIFMF